MKDFKREPDGLENDKDSDEKTPRDIDVNTYYRSTKHIIINFFHGLDISININEPVLFFNLK